MCIRDRLGRSEELPPSYIYNLIGTWHSESVIYLLLSLRDEQIWEAVTRYLDARDRVRVETNGHVLKAMGIKPGPIYSQILGELFRYRLDGLVTNQHEETSLVNQWIKEGKYASV